MNDDDLWEQLTDAERQDLEATREALRDVYGTSNLKSYEEGEAMIDTARKQLEEALEMLPQSDRQAYDEAVTKAPHLVEIESNPERYLKAFHYDPWASAQRIAAYWEKRKELFGDRAFLPMTVSGQGALSEEIVQAMKCGGTSVLPPDSHNRPGFITDRGKMCCRCADEDARIQILFYVLQTLFESDLALRNGYIIITTMGGDDDNSKKQTPRSKILQMFKSEVIPITIRAFHIVVFRKRSFVEGSIPIWLQLMERWKFLSMRTVVHFAESREHAMRDMKKYGFKEEGTVSEMGGTLDLDEEFKRWFDARLELETERLQAAASTDEAPPPHDDETTAGNLSALGNLAEVADRARREEAKARKRTLDAVYQRKKRKQNKQDFSEIKTEVESLQKNNAALKAEHSFLQSLLRRASELVGVLDRTSAPPPASVVTAPASNESVLNQLLNANNASAARVSVPQNQPDSQLQQQQQELLLLMEQHQNQQLEQHTRLSQQRRQSSLDSVIEDAASLRCRMEDLAAQSLQARRHQQQVEMQAAAYLRSTQLNNSNQSLQLERQRQTREAAQQVAQRHLQEQQQSREVAQQLQAANSLGPAPNAAASTNVHGLLLSAIQQQQRDQQQQQQQQQRQANVQQAHEILAAALQLQQKSDGVGGAVARSPPNNVHLQLQRQQQPQPPPAQQPPGNNGAPGPAPTPTERSQLLQLLFGSFQK